jgi:hypothetical protein
MLNAAQVTYAFGPPVLRGITIALPFSTAIFQTAVINLDPGEYFTRISGTYLTYPGSPAPGRVGSLTFCTNKQACVYYGVQTNEKPFEVQGPVYAFHGAVALGNTPLPLSAIGFWKQSVATQAAIGSDSNGDD